MTTKSSSVYLAFPVALSGCIGIFSYKCRDQSKFIRFPLGIALQIGSIPLVSKLALPAIKSILCGNKPQKDSPLWVMYYGLWSAILAKSATGFFGGQTYFDKHNITSYTQALINAILPQQFVFRNPISSKDDKKEIDRKKQEIKSGYFQLLYDVGKSIVSVAASTGILHLISRFKLLKTIQSSFLLHMEVTNIATSLFMGMYTLPCAVIGFLLNHHAKQTFMSNSFVWFVCHSPRAFWKQWSQAIGERYKYGVYIPLGGRNRPFIATLSVFLFNTLMHYDYSERVYGFGPNGVDEKRMKSGWNKAFATMGIAVASQIFCEEKCPKSWQETLWWKGVWLTVLHGSMCWTTHFVRGDSLPIDLADMVKNTTGPVDLED